MVDDELLTAAAGRHHHAAGEEGGQPTKKFAASQNFRSAFIPDENDGKQFISKDESELLRDSILRLNRPKFNRPSFEPADPLASSPSAISAMSPSAATTTSSNIATAAASSSSSIPAGTFLVKKCSPSAGSTGSARSSSGCSSDSQSSLASPVSSKCSSECGGNTGTANNNNNCGIATKATIPLAPLLSASLVQKAISGRKHVPMPPNNNNGTSGDDNFREKQRETSAISGASSVIQLPSSPPVMPFLLKRNEFPFPNWKGKNNSTKTNQQRKMPMQSMPPTQNGRQQFRHLIAAADPAEEVEELSRAARRQMAILEELELENRERKSKISSSNSGQKAAGLLLLGANSERIMPFDEGQQKQHQMLADNSNSSGSTTATNKHCHHQHHPPLQPNHTTTQSINGSGTCRSSSPFASSSNQIPTPSSPPEVQQQQHPAQRNNNCSNNNDKQSSSALGTMKSNGRHSETQLAQLRLMEDINNRKCQFLDTAGTMPKGDGNICCNGNGAGMPKLQCKTCNGMITDVILQALGSSFHPACFCCSRCGKCLDGIPFAVEQNGAVICMEDYQRHFVPHCHGCGEAINAVNEFGQIVRVIIADREYHIQCYCCEGCGMQLGNEKEQRCYPIGSHILCARCHTLWRRIGVLEHEAEAAISDL